jgi:hypothetical protein
MASKPIVDDAPESSLDATGYKDAESNNKHSGLYWTGIPSVVSFGNLLYQRFPELVEVAVNKALDKHVEEVRKVMFRDDKYRDLAPYYDVVQDEDEADTLNVAYLTYPPTYRTRHSPWSTGMLTSHPKVLYVRPLLVEPRAFLTMLSLI